jgi:hypothetical protein
MVPVRLGPKRPQTHGCGNPRFTNDEPGERLEALWTRGGVCDLCQRTNMRFAIPVVCWFRVHDRAAFDSWQFVGRSELAPADTIVTSKTRGACTVPGRTLVGRTVRYEPQHAYRSLDVQRSVLPTRLANPFPHPRLRIQNNNVSWSTAVR